MTKVADLHAPFDLHAVEWYFNRELSWLAYNRRVFAQVRDRRLPLLERVKFAAIAGAGIDEFFMKRIGGLKQQLAAGVQEVTVDGRSPQQQIVECHAFVRTLQKEREKTLRRLCKELRQAGIELLSHAELTTGEREAAREEYYHNIFPLVTPQSIDPAHPFPFISNLSLNLLVTLRYPDDRETSLARVKVPISAGAPRLVRIGPGERFVFLEDLMANNLDLLFPKMEVVGCELFRVTRNANTSPREEHADDLLALIESTLRDRKFAPIVRLQVRPGMAAPHRHRLAAELGLNEEADVFEVEGMMGVRDLQEIASLNLPALKVPPHHPVDHPALQTTRNIFHTLRDGGALLLQHPYESFCSSVGRFLREAAGDPKVRAIKMTLYRTSARSPLVETLVVAAQNGKQVAVVVELQARFDEEANIRLANRMEEAGIHVTYGVMGLKTHCKVILVVRQDYDGLRRYVHLGTGNYHPLTARTYSDLGLLLCDRDIGQDATELFNYLTTGYTPKRSYKKLLVAPKGLKPALLERIDREIARHTPEQPGHLLFKMNGLDDVEMVRALYRASQAGVKVELIVRDQCRLRPGIAGLSDHIRVVSIVGHFLEHARIYCFHNGGDEECFLGSADAMKRNLESRVEVLVPVEDPALRREVRIMLETQLADQVSAWDLRADGTYQQRRPADGGEISSQCRFIAMAQQRLHDATRLRKRKSKYMERRRSGSTSE